VSRPLAIAYVDGFNFYYGAVKDHPEFKWINFGALCDSLMTRSEVIAVRYYTARVEDRPDDPYQSQRQDVYLRALATLPRVEVVFGQFRTNTKVLRPARGRGLVSAVVTEEKGSDVNLATDLLWDALHQRMGVALVISNDFDLQRPIDRVITTGIEVVTVNPHRHKPQKASLRGTSTLRLRKGHLRASQLPDEVVGPDGHMIRRPREWR
jgi:hypothetical protein